MFTDLFNSTCEIQQKTETQDIYGQITLSWQTVSTHKCRLSTAPKEFRKEDGNYITTKRHYIMFVDNNVVVTKSNRLLHAGIPYEIVDVESYYDDSMTHHKEIYLIKIDNN